MYPDLFFPQKLKTTISQPLTQVTNGDGSEVQSSAVTHTAAPASPAPPPAPVPAAPLTPALATPEEPSTHSLQQPATSTTETPVSVHTCRLKDTTSQVLKMFHHYFVCSLSGFSGAPCTKPPKHRRSEAQNHKWRSRWKAAQVSGT